jgi:hypothetical protein
MGFGYVRGFSILSVPLGDWGGGGEVGGGRKGKEHSNVELHDDDCNVEDIDGDRKKMR